MADVEPFEVTPVRIELDGPGDGSDQRRADDAQVELPYDASEASRAATDVYDQSEGGALPLHRRLGHESVWWYGSEAQPCIAITTATDCTGRVPSRVCPRPNRPIPQATREFGSLCSLAKRRVV